MRKSLIEQFCAGANNGRKHEVRSLLANVARYVGKVSRRGVQADIALGQLLATRTLQDEVAHDPIRLVRIDVVAADEIGTGTKVPSHVRGQNRTVLIGSCAGIDDIPGEFEALVQGRVHQQSLPLFDHWNDGFASARHVASEDHIDLVLLHKHFGVSGGR